MPFPWNRDKSRGTRASRRRRQGRSGQVVEHAVASPVEIQAAKERTHKKISIAVGVVLMLVVLGIPSFGYYQEFYRPPRVWAGNVREVKFEMGDLVQRIRVLQGVNRYQGGAVDLGTVPFEYLQNLLHAEVLRQEAPRLGIVPSGEDIERGIRFQFEPTARPGEETDPGQLEREYKENYQVFLTATGLSDGEYRTIVEEQLSQAGLRLLLDLTIEDSQEQVELEWIRFDTRADVDILAVEKRLEIDDFGSVARDVGQPARAANLNGYVGWVPEKAFPDLDAVIFGDAERDLEPLPVGEISRQVVTGEGTYLIHKLSGPQTRVLETSMRAILSNALVDEWQTEQLNAGADEGWLKMNFNSDLYAWVADQVNLTRPRLPVTEQ